MKLTWRSELTDVCAAAMEAAWLSPVLLAVGYAVAGERVALRGLPLFMLLFAARFVARYLVSAQLDLGRSRLLVAYLAAGSMLLALKVQVYPTFSWLSAEWLKQAAADIFTLGPLTSAIILTVGTVVYAWQRGIKLAVDRPHHSDLFRQFQIGLLLVLGSVFLAGRAGLGNAFVPWVFWFFFWGLLAAAVARLEESSRSRQSAVESYWLPIVIAITTLIVIGGGLVALIYSPALTATVRQIIQPLAALLDILISILLLPIMFLVELLVFLLRRLLGPLPDQPQQQIAPLPSLDEILEQLRKQQREPWRLPDPVVTVVKLALLIAIAGVILFLLARALRRLRPEEDDGVQEVHESVWSPADLWAGLRGLWQRLLSALGMGRAQPRSPRAAPASPNERAAYSIRQIYTRLLELAAGLGQARQPAVTPYEFLNILTWLIPASQADLALITDAYVRVRYGALAAVDNLDQVQQAWLRVKQEGQRLRQEQAQEARARRATGA